MIDHGLVKHSLLLFYVEWVVVVTNFTTTNIKRAASYSTAFSVTPFSRRLWLAASGCQDLEQLSPKELQHRMFVSK